MAVCAAVFVVQLLADRFFPFTAWFGLSPRLLSAGAVWRIVTYMFLHGGIFHFLFNMLALYMFGGEVERRMGAARFTAFWFFCGMGAGLCTVALAWGSSVSVVGASGAIFGVLLAYARYYPDRPVTLLLFLVLPVTLTARWLVALYAGMEAVILLSQDGKGLGHVAHLGGLLFAGLFLRGPDLGRALRDALSRRRARSHARAFGLAEEDRRRARTEMDRLLDKISKQGMAGLSELERRRLYEASERLRRP
jgi:membrane associated rhomboid family serine protease